MLSCERCLKYAEEKHYCPYCNERLSCCESPPMHVGDGLGWGAEVMFICLNNDCPTFDKGWEHIEEQYGHSGSYRYMLLPGQKKGEIMMVGSKDAFTGCVVDPEALMAQNKRYHAEKEALDQLDASIEAKDIKPALHLLLDEHAALLGREKACDSLYEINDLNCIDPIRNHTFKNIDIEQKVNMTVAEILKANFKKECPYCAEIIKKQAKVCMHCNKDL
ncbi:MAG: zinc ribbon domain-containing protein [Desulfobulbaceae bacterium]|uniref:Zinc ribbon domain-containing protein n=1 Tax=Candidatus Desulfobia pelagia TaxID=2841692 RepID=A0A8J6N9F5_9BACT|nr:zinc ribbon domain-containing protein [Candidatus Desulfobia pelagia]